MENFKKTVLVGRKKNYAGRAFPVFCKIIFSDGKLSITGVEGPLSSGNAIGSCGQIDMSYKTLQQRRELTPGEGWNRAKIKKFFEVWGEWHLNDMKADCKHQRKSWDTGKKLKVVEYNLKYEVSQEQDKIKDESTSRLVKGETVKLTKAQKDLLGLKYFVKGGKNPGAKFYEEYKRITKSAGWVNPEEHPGGLLGKPCEVCGYKYGSSWNRAEVPADVLEFLKGLPESPKTPAWV